MGTTNSPLYSNIKKGFDLKMKKHRYKGRKKLNKLKVSITVFLIVIAITLAVFGRYFYNSIREAYFTSKKFYFTSNLLTLGNQTYTYENWGGVDTYEIDVDLYSYANQLEKIDYDLEYWISCETSQTDKIKCTINSVDGPNRMDGIIYSDTNVSQVKICVTPLAQINKGESVKVLIKAGTEEPYKKEISCEVTIKVGDQIGNSYEIDDAENRDYAVLKLLNVQDTAVQVTLTFDPRVIRLDLNDEIYKNNEKIETTTINGTEYVRSIVFNMDKESAKNVKFYKVDTSKSYKYPNGDTSSIINVTL